MTLLSHTALLSTDECIQTVKEVLGLRGRWGRVSNDPGRYKLGAAAYVEARESAASYLTACKENNAVLARHFGPLYDRLAAALRKKLDAPVEYADEFALPGFHILLAEENTQPIKGARHRDEQHHALPWPEPPTPQHPTVSFTLPVALPGCGSGLVLWPDADGPGEYHPYVVGDLVTHSGEVLHQAVAGPPGTTRLAPDDQRITLQGHGVRVGDAWLLYF